MRNQTPPNPTGPLGLGSGAGSPEHPRGSRRIGGGTALLLVAGGTERGRSEAPSWHRQPRPRRQNAPNELVKHLYNFSSFYKEGLLYTSYTWR